jgi:hypothetical protein
LGPPSANPGTSATGLFSTAANAALNSPCQQRTNAVKFVNMLDNMDNIWTVTIVTIVTNSYNIVTIVKR